MKLVSVNVGRTREVLYQKEMISTGIYKSAVEGRVIARGDGVEGDQQADLAVHGGIDKAVYAYPFEHYAHWQQVLDRDDFEHGQFGENLTLEGLLEDDVSVGDLLRIGEVTLQVSQPREPCSRLGIRMGDATFIKRFHQSRLSGFYLRVVEEGTLAAGDPVERIHRAENSFTIAQLYGILHFGEGDAETIRRAANLPELAMAWREPLRQLLEQQG